MTQKEPENPTTDKPKDQADKTANSTAVAKSNKGIFFSFLIFLIAAAALAFSVYIAQQGLLLRDEVSKLQTELSQLRLLDQQPIIQSLTQEISKQNQAQQHLQDELNQRFNEWQQIYEKSQSLSERKKDDWILNEAAYLMRIAATRLYLANDINSTIAALTQADLRLGELENPRYLPIRKALATEISALQGIKKPDINGIILKIDNLLNNLPGINDLQVSTETKLEEKPSNQAATSVLSKVLEIINFKDGDGSNNKDFDRQNLLFKNQQLDVSLELSKAALIRMQYEEFKLHLQEAQSLLKNHYKADSDNVKQASSLLNYLLEEQLIPEYPDITGSLNLLQSNINRYKQPSSENNDKEETPTAKQAT